jgi:signal transduction histidine kinase
MEAIHTRGSSTHECRIRTDREEDGGALDLEVQATYFSVEDTNLVMVAMRDISSRKRRDVLERTFFHDVLNTATGLQAVAELLSYGDEDPDIEDEYRQDLRRLSTQIADEIKGQRQLLAAETGELELNVAPVAVPEIIEAVAEMYRHHSVARERHLVIADCPEIEIETDATLVRRVLGNLVKNAFEAIVVGQSVTISAEETGGKVLFKVHNPGVIPGWWQGAL